MASTVSPAYLLPALTAVPLISDSIDHPLVHFHHCFNSFSNIQFSISQWLTACCGIKTAPNWKRFSPQGGLDPISGRGSWPQGGAVLAWPRTMHKSSTGKKSKYHQLCWMLCIQMWLAVKLLLSVQYTSHKGINWQFHKIYLYIRVLFLYWAVLL